MNDLKNENATVPLRSDVKFAMGVASLLGVLAVSATNTIVDLDLFHQMALFREYLANGAMPMSDSFAYTPTRETVVHHEWGMGAIQYYAMVGSGLGGFGLMLLKYLLTFAICFICYFVSRKNGAPFALIVLLAPIALSVGGYIGFTNVRAQVVTLLFVAIQFWMFSCDREGKKLWCLWWIPMMVAWTNIHGGVVAGVAIFFLWVGIRFVEAMANEGLYSAIREGAHRLGLSAVLPALMCINPWGAAYLPYLLRAVRMKRPMIGEWSSILGSGDIGMLAMFGLSIFLAVVAAATILRNATNRKFALRFLFPTLVIVVTWVMAGKNIRHASIFAVAWMCYAPMLLANTEFHQWILQSIGNNQKLIRKASWGIAMLALAFSLNAKFFVANVPAFADEAPVGSPIYPVHAVNWLQENEIGGNMMVWFNDGAYVSWRMYPHVKVSLDSRYEVAYPHGAVEESVAFYNAEDSWRDSLNKYPTEMVLAPASTAIVKAMTEAIEDGSLSWKVMYRDESFTLFGKVELLAMQK